MSTPARRPKPIPPRTPVEDCEYHLAMWKLMQERGYPFLAESHGIAADDVVTSYPGAFA